MEKLSDRMTDLDEAIHVRRRGPLVEVVDDDVNHATLFERRGGSLAVLRRFGEGSGVEPLVRESAGV